ncbi:MAG TPA: SRPBCC domain-containing protein [Thermoanaerobaculia bacterium]
MGEDAVTRDVLVRVSPERAFDAFVELSDVLAWLADGAVIGKRPGGNWGLGWYADPDSDAGYSSIGQFEVFDPGRRFVVSNLMFSTPEGDSLGPMRLVVEFEKLQEGTCVTVTQSGFEESAAGAAYRDQIGPGWERMLSDLKIWLEQGRKLPGR